MKNVTNTGSERSFRFERKQHIKVEWYAHIAQLTAECQRYQRVVTLDTISSDQIR